MNENSSFEREMKLYEVANFEFEYEEFENNISEKDLQPADIILSTVKGDPLSYAIRTVEQWISKLDDPLASHSAVYIGNNLIVEAIGPGVTVRSLDEKLKDDTYALVLRYNGSWGESPEDKKKKQKIIIRYLRDQSQFGKNKKYDVLGAIKSVIFKNYKGDTSKFYCSELILRAYEQAGIILISNQSQAGLTTQYTPEHLRHSMNLEQIGFLKKSTDKEYSQNYANEFNEYEMKEVILDKIVEYINADKTDLNLHKIPYFQNLPKSKAHIILGWYENLKKIRSIYAKNKKLDWILGFEQFIGTKFAPAGFVAAIAAILMVLSMIKDALGVFNELFIKPIKARRHFPLEIYCLAGISYAIVARNQSKPTTPPTPFSGAPDEDKKSYIIGAGNVGEEFKKGGDITPFPGIELMTCTEAVNNVFGLFGQCLYEHIGGKRWKIIKSMTGTLQWPQGNTHTLETWNIISSANKEFESNLNYNYNMNNQFELEDNEYDEYEDEYDDEYDDEYEDGYENEYDDEYEDGYENEYDDEYEDEYENEFEDDEVEENYAEALQELADGNFDSEYEASYEIDRGLDEMEREYFTRRLTEKERRQKRRRRRRRQNRRDGKGKRTFGKILKVGGKILGGIAKNTPIGKVVSAGTKLVTGDFKGMAKDLAGAAVGTLVPGGAAIADATLDALDNTGNDKSGGGEESEVRRRQRRRRVARKVAKITRDGFKELADNLMPEELEDPEEAFEAAKRAMDKAMKKNNVNTPRTVTRVHHQKKHPSGDEPTRRIIKIKPGEQIIIRGLLK